MKNNLLIFAVLISFSSSTFGQCWDKACKGPAAELLEYVYVHENGNIYLKITDPQANLLACTLSGGHMTLEPSNIRQKEIYATVLNAISMQKTLTLRIAENSTNCRVLYVMMNTNS